MNEADRPIQKTKQYHRNSEDQVSPISRTILGRRRKSSKVYKRVIVRTPSRNSAQVPILVLLSRLPSGEMQTREVLRHLRDGHWFEELTERDFQAVYQKSRKYLFQTVIKFSRKNLVIEKQLYPVGVCPLGIWKITPAGIERAEKEGPSWEPTYTIREALVETSDSGSDGL
jgi:hypothetical protein